MKKAVITAVALTLVVCLAIGGTLAYLMQKTDPVTNTFAVGDINIELKEHELVNGVLGTNEVTSNNTYKVVPGGSQPKDPFVRVAANSEDCWVYVCVVNNMVIDKNIVVTYEVANTWTQVATQTDANTGVVTTLYRYNAKVETSNQAQTLSVFTTVSYSKDILKTNIQQLKDKTIVLTAFAHQSANVNQTEVDKTAKTQFGLQ